MGAGKTGNEVRTGVRPVPSDWNVEEEKDSVEGEGKGSLQTKGCLVLYLCVCSDGER